ncbi:MAG: hypothetical protein ACRDON_11490 [Gaiellaceae bacterium]
MASIRFTRTRGLALALGMVLGLASPSAAETATDPEPTVLEQIRKYRGETWRWQRVMGRPLTPTGYGERRASEASRVWIRDVWKRRAAKARRRAHHPPHLRAWLCIHRYEGHWRDPDPLYYGGLQMDLVFQRTYGLRLLRRRGTADHWTPLEQMWVAEKALRAGRGFHPWPVSARRCGLL